MNLIVLRYGELFLKGGNRRSFENRLVANAQRLLLDLDGIRLGRGQGRLFVHCTEGTLPRAQERLTNLFGLASLSPAVEVTPELTAIGDQAVALTKQRLAERQLRTFRVQARRSDKQFPSNSMEINALVGHRIIEATGLGVDLHHPDLVVGIEVGPSCSFVFLDKIRCSGGLPVGATGKVGLLLSGGIDSPVAGYLMQKRGCVVAPIYFHSFPYTGERTRAKVAQLAGILRAAQERMVLRVVPFTAAQLAIRDHCPTELSVVLYRRMMMRIASRVARQHSCVALATGESLGQVASQTLENIACIEQAAELPVLRPLLTFDKAETIELARRIGSYELSIAPYDDCCSLFVPKHPSTKTRLSVALAAEERLDLEALVLEALEGVEEVEVEAGAAALV